LEATFSVVTITKLSPLAFQFGTRLESFRDKTKLLTKCSDDIKLLLREGYDVKLAKETAEKFFGKKKISFIAIDVYKHEQKHKHQY
jgi:hypothetical protein